MYRRAWTGSLAVAVYSKLTLGLELYSACVDVLHCRGADSGPQLVIPCMANKEWVIIDQHVAIFMENIDFICLILGE